MSEVKSVKRPKRRGGLLRMRLRPDRSARLARDQEPADKRLQSLQAAFPERR